MRHKWDSELYEQYYDNQTPKKRWTCRRCGIRTTTIVGGRPQVSPCDIVLMSKVHDD